MYIGNTPTSQNFTSGTDYFNGDGTTVAFPLSRSVNSPNDIEVFVNNVAQQPNSGYTVLGTALTFTAAPSSGTSNIYVRYLSTATISYGSGTSSTQTVGTAQINPYNMIYTNNSVLTTSYTLPASINGMVTGPYTVNTGVTLTISTGSTFVVV
jgi:hypothetical protein